MLKKTMTYIVLALLALHSTVSMAREKSHAPVSDTAITAKVKMLYAKSPEVKGSNISVTTVNHTVLLSGKVHTDEEYDRAVSLASSVSGVNEVDASKLAVTASKSPVSDTYITAKVKGALLKEKLFGDKDVEYWPVKVETKNGIVYLTGKVDTTIQKDNAAAIIKRVKGVKRVESTVTVK